MKTIKALVFILTLTLLSVPTYANSKKHEHREHEAHSHGSGMMSLAFDGKNGKIEFKSSAESILGFEYLPKKETDKKILKEATDYFENNSKQLIQLDPSLNCQFTKESIGQVPEENEKKITKHSDWSARWSVTCDKPLSGSKITFDFTKFKNLKDLDVTILADSIQKSVEYKGKVLSVELK